MTMMTAVAMRDDDDDADDDNAEDDDDDADCCVLQTDWMRSMGFRDNFVLPVMLEVFSDNVTL